jgi:hypothetical protein
LLNLTVPAALIITNACSDTASPPAGTGGTVNSATGGTPTSTGGVISTSTGGVISTSTGGVISTSTGGAVSTGTGGSTSTSTGGIATSMGGSLTTSTGGSSTTATGGSTGTTGGTTGTTGGAAATGGSGGAVAKVKLCATKTAITIPLMTNFDSYDGMKSADAWAFPFNGTAADPGVPYAGPYTFNDGTGTPFLGMVGGANLSMYAIEVSNPMATKWGGAVAFWMGCANASTFSGLSFQARGTLPTGKVSVSLTMEQTTAPDATDPNGGGTCDAGVDCKNPGADVAVTADWTLIKIPWAMFAPGVGSAKAAVPVNGDGIAGLTFQVGLVYAENPVGSMMYLPTPAMYQFQLDDLGFY